MLSRFHVKPQKARLIHFSHTCEYAKTDSYTTNIKMRIDTSAFVLLKFHLTINISAKVNMKDKLTSHIHIILRMYDKNGIFNDSDINEFPVLYIEICIFFIYRK